MIGINLTLLRTGKALPFLTCVLVFGLALYTGCSREEKILETDPAKRLLAQSVKALGGMKKATSWTTRVEEGRLTSIWPGWGTLQAKCTHYVEKPGKLLLDQDYSAYDHPFYFTHTYNQGEAWTVVNLGIRQSPSTTQNLEQRLRTADGPAYYLSQCDTFFLVAEVPDDSLLTGSGLDRIGCVDRGDTVYFDLDKVTHLPARKIESGPRGLSQTIMRDYRETGGLQVPFHLTVYQNGVKASEFNWEKITFNNRIDPALFEENRPAKEED
ncbi:MAG: hypothetical protein JXB45_07385 [Candidatus Krumholzibacteriota bacterium]|nr:hypothetical protein [Candidatus Krumholzibacteriota bacterium]